MKIAFLVQLPKNVSPGQRFRIEQYENSLLSQGFTFDTFPFFDNRTYPYLYKSGYLWQKVVGIFRGFYNRFLFTLRAKKYDFIFLQREAAPLGPPFFEWIFAKVLKKRIILDFDDAIWINDEVSNPIWRAIKCYWKVKYICRWSHEVAVGNHYLANYARLYNRKVTLIPTSVETKFRYNRCKIDNSRPVIGWTGSHSTLKYLNIIYPVLKRLEKEFDFDFLVICNEAPAFQLQSLEFVPWREATEIEDLLRIDIGLMPLEADAWSEGKCGFKIIQYLALCIPAVASPVGVNNEIIEDGRNGFLCNGEEQWYVALKALLQNKHLQIQFGKAGRQKIEAEYSVSSNADVFLSLFKN